MKHVVKLDNYFSPRQLEQKLKEFVGNYCKLVITILKLDSKSSNLFEDVQPIKLNKTLEAKQHNNLKLVKCLKNLRKIFHSQVQAHPS